MTIVGSNEKSLGNSGANIKVMVILNENAKLVARFNVNSNYANLNCNMNSDNSNSNLGITCWSLA